MVTKRQREILLLFSSASVPPTFQELCDQMGLKSTATIREHLEVLERKGLLERDQKGTARNWRLTELARGYLTRLERGLKEQAEAQRRRSE